MAEAASHRTVFDNVSWKAATTERESSPNESWRRAYLLRSGILPIGYGEPKCDPACELVTWRTNIVGGMLVRARCGSVGREIEGFG